MYELQDVMIAGAARTAVGGFGGGLKDMAPTELGAVVAREALNRAGVGADAVEHVVMGQVIQTEPKDVYLARVVGMAAGAPASAAALTVNRLCGSGLQAIVSAAQIIRLGEAQVVVAGGAESMSRAPHLLTEARWGRRMGDIAAIDALTAALHDPFGAGHMGVTAENVAALCGVDRPAQDRFALESHRRAVAAQAEGRFRSQIVPVEVKTRKGVVTMDTDEHPRPGLTLEDVAKLKPVFREGGTVTAGNASGLNDGAAALVMTSGREAERRGLTPLARIVGWGYGGVAPETMGLGPIEAVPRALASAGLDLAQIDVIENNEAFAAQACAVAAALGFDPDRTNPNGGAVALGHPVGATGAIITVKALYELQRAGGRYGLITLCIGGGQGIAMVIERVG